jgi:hypothetical protein
MPRSQLGRPDRGEPWTRGKRVRGLRMLAAAVIVLGACEGDTLYDLPTVPGGPGPGPIPPGTGRGELVNIPGVGVIADMVVDPATQRVFLSNHGQHRLELLDLADLQFQAAGVPVGSEPWGLAMNLAGDRVIVANSGGTNISFVDPAAAVEDVAQRFTLPRVILYNYTEQSDEEGNITSIGLEYFNYADRPQHVAQDAHGRLVYSAVATQASPAGTLRLAERRAGWQTWDTRLMFVDGSPSTNPPGENRALEGDPQAIAIANVDSVTLVWAEVNGIRFLTGEVVMVDHRPGTLPTDPDHVIRSDPLPIVEAHQQMRARGSDAVIYPVHRWNIPESTAIADTTFVVASADRRWIAVGEGLGTASRGRILLWGAGPVGGDGALSRVEDVRDIVNNTADRIFGVDLNANGTLGAARGSTATYFFGNDLRLQGLTAAQTPAVRGVGFLPGSLSNRTLAFEPTGNRTVRILETTHYRSIGEVPLRETITGPFRVDAPRPGVTACPAELADAPADCVVATVYGVTVGRRLLVLDIRNDDIIR